MKNVSTVPGIGTPSSNRPYGPFGDDSTPGDGTGTAVRTDWMGDLYYALTGPMNDVGLTPDDSEEGVTTGQMRTMLEYFINKTGFGSGSNPFKNLRVYPATAHPTYQVTITYDEFFIGWKKATSGSFTVDITASGALGLDTGSEASSTWYYIWMIMKLDGTLSALLSVSSTSPTLPSGYIYKKIIGAVRNDGSSNFIVFQQKNKIVSINGVLAYNNNTGGGFVSVDISAIVPTLIVNTIGGYIYSQLANETTTISVDGILSSYALYSAGAPLHSPYSQFPLIGNTTYIKTSGGSLGQLNISVWELNI